MARKARIVCDGVNCTAQVEYYADEYFRSYQGMIDTPPGWYQLNYRPKPLENDPRVGADQNQPRHFCSVECVQTFTGGINGPIHVTGKDWRDKGEAAGGFQDATEAAEPLPDPNDDGLSSRIVIVSADRPDDT